MDQTDSVIALAGLLMGLPAVIVMLVLMTRSKNLPADHSPEAIAHRRAVYPPELLDRDREAVLHL